MTNTHPELDALYGDEAPTFAADGGVQWTLPILDREPGPYAFTRHPDQIARDAEMLAEDLVNEHFDNTSWDRD